MATAPDVPAGRFAELGGPVHYVEWNGPVERTFVLVHGLGGSHLSWSLIGRDLSRHGRVIAIDLAGFGRTPRDGRSSKLSANRALLARFLDEVVGRPAVLVGNSMGGAIVMLQAAREPASAESVVLTGSVFPWARGGLPSPLVMAGFALYQVPVAGEWAARQRLAGLSAERAVRLGFRVVTADPSPVPEELIRLHVELFAEGQQDPDLGPALLEAARSLLALGRHRELARRVLEAVRCPVLVIHGQADRFVPVAFARAESQRHSSWHVQLQPGVGHVPMIEAPDLWIAAVENWLRETAAPLPAQLRDRRLRRT
ncbi:MAG: alpha/beta fold hydrolase [Actinomycetota bacterium]